MNIGLLAAQRTSGGGVAFRRHLTAALAAHDDVDRLVVFGDPSAGGTGDAVIGVGASDLGPFAAMLEEVVALPRLVRRHRVDVLICPGSSVPPRLPVPRIFWPLTVAPIDDHGRAMFADRTGWARRWLMRRLLGASCRRADAVIFSSRFARDLYAGFADLDHTPDVVIHPAGTVPTASHRAGRMPWGNSPHALMVSHLYRYKMVGEAIDGFADFIARTGAPHILVIAGNATDASYFTDLRQRVATAGLNDRVHLLGAVPSSELAALYSSASVFIFSSACENAGSYAVVDALAHGLPIVCSNLSSTPEIVGDAALMYDPRNPGELSHRLEQLATSEALETQLRALARTRAESLPSWQEIADAVVRFARRGLSG